MSPALGGMLPAEPHAADLGEFLPTDRSMPCLVARTLAVLSDKDRLNFEAALAHPDVTTAKIVERFWARDHRVGKESVREHRKGLCCCER